VCAAEVTTARIYRGVVPFISIEIVALGLLGCFPRWISVMFD
jgi:TRAP-type mannitol/chloroaromatic compound transport system permease large subunit